MMRAEQPLQFVVGGAEPNNALQKAMVEIVGAVKSRLCAALRDEETGLIDVHPRTIISMVATNILVGLLEQSIGHQSTITYRLKMVQSALDEISDMTMGLWKALEAQEANEKIAH